MAAELACGDLEARARTRLLYAVGDEAAARAKADLEDAERLLPEWRALLAAADDRDAATAGAKRRFREATRRDAAAFASETRALAARLRERSPGAAGVPLDDGLAALRALQDEAAALASRRDALRLAERLFGLEPEPLPALAEAEAELKRLGAVFGAYAEFAAARRSYSGQLWAELDVDRMAAAVDKVGGG